MFTQEEISIANATYRSKGSSVFDSNGNVRSIVAKFVANNISPDVRILDFGCGPEFIQGKYLMAQGFNVDAWDFGDNKPQNCVEKLEPVYDVVYASNVLNVISSLSMLMETLDQIYNCMKDGGVFVANYPKTPRKMLLTDKDLETIIQSKFNGQASKIHGVSAPMWVFTKIAHKAKRMNIGA
jgi:hypothetical protein